MIRLKELRKEKNLTQSELGKLLDLNQTAIGKYERGELEPSTKTLIALSNIFEVSIDYILGRTDEEFVIRKNKPAPLPADQQELNNLFQLLAPVYRVQVLEYTRYMAERSGVNIPNAKKRG